MRKEANKKSSTKGAKATSKAATKAPAKKKEESKAKKAKSPEIGSHVKAAPINLPNGRQRFRAIWDVTTEGNHREGTVRYRGKTFQVKENAKGSWDVVHIL